MNVIIVSKSLRTPKKLCLTERRIQALMAGALLLLMGLGFTTGFLVRGANGAALAEVKRLQDTLAVQQARLDDASGQAQREINALAAQMWEKSREAKRRADRANGFALQVTTLITLLSAFLTWKALRWIG